MEGESCSLERGPGRVPLFRRVKSPLSSGGRRRRGQCSFVDVNRQTDKQVKERDYVEE